MQITSVQNPRIKAAAKLRDRRDRDQQQRFVIDGRREVACAIDGGFQMLEVFYRPETRAAEPELSVLIERLRAAGADCFEVSRDVLAKVAFGQRDEGLVAVAAARSRTLDEIVLPPCPLVIVLDGLEKPGNVGAVLRTADGAGASAVVLSGTRADVFNPNTIRASLGAVFTLPVVVADQQQTLAWLRQNRLAIIAARVDAPRPHFAARYDRPTALILGSEAEGLGSAWQAADIQAVHLPMQGRVDSLNVSVTAAVLLYEAVRQRCDQAHS